MKSELNQDSTDHGDKTGLLAVVESEHLALMLVQIMTFMLPFLIKMEQKILCMKS